jgi:hypothetical protein
MSRLQNDRRKQQRSAATPRQAREMNKYELSEESERRRFIADLFTFWFACPDDRCRRRRACAGDPYTCFERYWWLVPETHKINFRTFIRARVAGMSVQQANRACKEEIARSAEHIARVDAEVVAKIAADKAARHGK